LEIFALEARNLLLENFIGRLFRPFLAALWRHDFSLPLAAVRPYCKACVGFV
jgi:hypothetical protein